MDDQHRASGEKATEEASDPVVELLLGCLEQEIREQPGTSVAAVPVSLRDRASELVGDMDVDLDAEIEGDIVI